jgi:hypothetical protein
LHIAAHHLVLASHSKTATPQTRTGASRHHGNRTTGNRGIPSDSEKP